MKHFFLLATLCLWPVWLMAGHDFEYKDYNWEARRSISPLSAEEQKEPVLVMKDKRVFEYVYDKEGKLKIYQTVHKIVRVQNDEAVHRHNKVYIAMSEVMSIIQLKARFISRSGSIREMDKNNIRELENPSNAGAYKIFAIEGVEVGGEIEYFYTLEQKVRLFGREFFQGQTPARNISLEIISPEHLLFEAKSYNGFPQLNLSKTQYAQKNLLSVEVAQVAPLTEEAFSLYIANLMRVEFKLAYNYQSGQQRILTWDDAAQMVYQNIYQAFKGEKKIMAQAAHFIAEMIPTALPAQEDSIKAIENYIKTNIREADGNGPEFEQVSAIFENKYASQPGIVRLFALLFTATGIEHQLVMTTDRSQARFDGSFESWYYLEKYLFFFPKTKNYLAPNQPQYRYGLLPYYCTNNDGLFISTWQIGERGMASAEIRRIPPVSYKRNSDYLDITLRFAPELDEIQATLNRYFTGYSAAQLNYYYQQYSGSEQNSLIKRLLRRTAQDAQIIRTRVNQSLKNNVSAAEQFSLEADIKSSSLLENAGDKYLFKIGELIGQQSALYQQQRHSPTAENDYNRFYQRTIRFDIPPGYIVRNLEDLNFEAFLEEGKDRLCSFKARYSLEGNKVKVEIEEYYKKLIYSGEQFEAFRRVINAAADFNKVALVFQKK